LEKYRAGKTRTEREGVRVFSQSELSGKKKKEKTGRKKASRRGRGKGGGKSLPQRG